MGTKPIYRALSVYNDVRAASKGPGAYGRRIVRRSAHKSLARLLRTLLR